MIQGEFECSSKRAGEGFCVHWDCTDLWCWWLSVIIELRLARTLLVTWLVVDIGAEAF